MPTPSMYNVDAVAQFDFLLSTLRQQLQEAQSTADKLKQHHISGSRHQHPDSGASISKQRQSSKKTGDAVVCMDDISASGSTALVLPVSRRPQFHMTSSPPLDEGLPTGKTLAKQCTDTSNLDWLDTKSPIDTYSSIETDDVNLTVGTAGSSKATSVAFKDQHPLQSIRAGSSESNEDNAPKLGNSKSSLSRLSSQNSLTFRYQDVHNVEEDFRSNNIKLKSFMAAFLALLVINAAIAIVGFRVFDMHHEDEPWRYVATEEIWVQKGVSKWSQTYKGFLHTMEAADFQKFSCAISYITVLYVGFGSEAIVGVFLLNNLSNHVLEQMWVVAQFVFPLLLSMAFQFSGQQNPWSYLFFIVGMWKFCFPETMFYLVKAISWNQGILQWCSDVGNGMGTLMHHSACTMLLCLLQAGMIQMNQVALCLILPLILQHLVVLTKYQSLYLYALLEVALEIVWEMEVISILQNTSGCPWFAWAALMSLLVAHWLYWTAAIFQGLADLFKTDPEPDDCDGDEIKSFQTSLSEVTRESMARKSRGSMSIATPTSSRNSAAEAVAAERPSKIWSLAKSANSVSTGSKSEEI